MNTTKPLNPYSRLLAEIRDHFKAIKTPKVSTNCSLDAAKYPWLHERVTTANQLGYDTKLVSSKNGVDVVFVERVAVPYVPYKWKL